VGLHGPLAWDAARRLFRTRKGAELPAKPTPGRFWLGRLGTDLADEVVLTLKQLEPVPWLEAHCHGGREAVRLIIELFQAHGLTPCSWEDFLRKTEDDRLRAEAAIALARAPTARTAAILLAQYHGAFARALDDILLSLERGDVAVAKARLDELARFASLGRHLTTPWRVTVAGAPNVGKSSLVNALAGYQRSVVAPTPGTTRDVVTVTLAIDGWPVELADTAGLRTGGEQLEAAGIHLARRAAAEADLCLWVLDASAEPIWPDGGAAAVRFVVNKMDLPAVWDLERAGEAIRVSARVGQGLDDLCSALGRWLVPAAPPSGTAVPFTDNLCSAIEQARQLVTGGSTGPARELLRSLRSEPNSVESTHSNVQRLTR
jgi:tRNA modification GTPase